MPSEALVRRVESEIRRFFVVSDEEAHGEAWLLAAPAEGWGSLEHALTLDWTHLVKKALDGRFEWKSDQEREAFHADLKRKDDEKETLLKLMATRPKPHRPV
ncbi:MAG TPA: hypothetical protein VMV72_00040 [Verrucomicrobiae bacterium]|nr:hypothetical protein [Verrucomicrobiae bacterium]